MSLQPKTWEDLLLLLDNKQVPGREPRYLADQLLYSRHQEGLGRVVTLSILTDQITLWQKEHNCFNQCLLPNTFGYTKLLHYLPYVKHFVLWTDNSEKDKSVIKLQIYNWLAKMYGIKATCDKLPIYFFENNANEKSVPEKPHFQVLVNFQNY